VQLRSDAFNALTNPGFDASGGSWSVFYGDQTFEYSTTQAHTGTTSGLITATADTEQMAARQIIAPTPGVRYAVTAWMYVPSTNAHDPIIRVSVIFWDGASQQTRPETTMLCATDTWVPITLDLDVCPVWATQMHIGIGLENCSAGDVAYIDDAVLSVTTSNATGTLQAARLVSGSAAGTSRARGVQPTQLHGSSGGTSNAQVKDSYVVGGYPLPENQPVGTPAGLQRVRHLSGSATGTSALSITASGTQHVTATSSGTSTAVATTRRNRCLIAAASGTCTTAATPTRRRAGAGSGSGTSTCAGVSVRSRALRGSTTGAATAGARVTLRRNPHIYRPHTAVVTRPDTGLVSKPTTAPVSRPSGGTVTRPTGTTVVRPL
jgi:hypothetical protein